ncbi:amino acid ABC transporter permease [Aminobacter sp. MSH1]|uniref:amino acid ABC transporter permease n=1 Tax=Aminobacter sp. MSH1 TaxID=374606 RepID=UPI000D363E59|nr:amino acid ABC transporter permease [Aminobacter sp. MSH1]
MIRDIGLTEILMLVHAAGWTLMLAVIAFVLGVILALPLALMRAYAHPIISRPVTLYIELIQATPVLMLIFLGYFGLSFFGLQLPAIVAASLALTLYSSAYLSEICRGSIVSVGVAQWEASAALAMTPAQQLRYVILPQSLKVALAPTIGFTVQLIKNTSMTALIGFVELTRAGQILNNITFQPFVVFCIVALFYFVICYPLSIYGYWLERKLNVGR